MYGTGSALRAGHRHIGEERDLRDINNGPDGFEPDPPLTGRRALQVHTGGPTSNCRSGCVAYVAGLTPSGVRADFEILGDVEASLAVTTASRTVVPLHADGLDRRRAHACLACQLVQESPHSLNVRSSLSDSMTCPRRATLSTMIRLPTCDNLSDQRDTQLCGFRNR